MRALPDRPEVVRIDVTCIDGVWGWDAYDAHGDDADSQELPRDEEGPQHHDPTDEQVFVGLEVSLANPLAPGCELVIHWATSPHPAAPPGDARYVWRPVICPRTGSYTHRGCECPVRGEWERERRGRTGRRT